MFDPTSSTPSRMAPVCRSDLGVRCGQPIGPLGHVQDRPDDVDVDLLGTAVPDAALAHAQPREPVAVGGHDVGAGHVEGEVLLLGGEPDLPLAAARAAVAGHPVAHHLLEADEVRAAEVAQHADGVLAPLVDALDVRDDGRARLGHGVERGTLSDVSARHVGPTADLREVGGTSASEEIR